VVVGMQRSLKKSLVAGQNTALTFAERCVLEEGDQMHRIRTILV
jgi:hypothetical protein